MDIGEGNYSKIFKASKKEEPEEKVAIKCISKKKAYGELDHAIQDVDKLIKISNPNVIKYFERYEDKKTLFIVMEYVQGKQADKGGIYSGQESLFDILDKVTDDGKAFSEYEAALIAKKLLQTIDYCHRHKVMHKDIKPKKILFTEEGELKLIDFGLSKWKSTGHVHTASGTPYYLAPEVLTGVRTSKSDIWSIGVLIYCLLSGSLPFVTDSQETVYEKAQEADIHFDGKIWGSVSYEGQDLISKMITKDYHHRYSADE